MGSAVAYHFAKAGARVLLDREDIAGCVVLY